MNGGTSRSTRGQDAFGVKAARGRLKSVGKLPAARCSFSGNVDSPTFCTDTLMDSFNSLMSREISLLRKNNSLFQILGNFGKKHKRLLRFLTSQTANYARNRTISLYFP
jgi:hypothetical protein